MFVGSLLFEHELNELNEFMENGIIIDGHTYELIDDSSITQCDDCALLDKCCEFWAMADEENPKLCTFLYGEKANNKRFHELNEYVWNDKER